MIISCSRTRRAGCCFYPSFKLSDTQRMEDGSVQFRTDEEQAEPQNYPLASLFFFLPRGLNAAGWQEVLEDEAHVKWSTPSIWIEPVF